MESENFDLVLRSFINKGKSELTTQVGTSKGLIDSGRPRTDRRWDQRIVGRRDVRPSTYTVSLRPAVSTLTFL